MNLLVPYVEEHGREAVAEELSALLGKKIAVSTLALHSSPKRKAPKAWVEALGLDSSSPLPQGPPESAGGENQSETPPKAPEGAEIVRLHPQPIEGFARQRIAGTYGLIGSGLGSALGNDGVGKVWDDYSGPIADAWIEAAKTNEFARRFVEFMTAGGPMGEVVFLHVTLIAGTLYVAGQFPEVGLFGKYAQYRREPPQPSARVATAESDGSPEQGAEDILGATPQSFGP